MPTNQEQQRRYTAPSGFDSHVTEPFAQPVVPDTDPAQPNMATAPVGSVEAVFAAIDPEVTHRYDAQSADMLHGVARQLPGFSADLTATLGSLKNDIDARAGQYVHPYEELLMKLGSAELEVFRARHVFAETHPTEAQDIGATTQAVITLIDTLAANADTDEKRQQLKKDKEAVAYLASSDELDYAQGLRRSNVASELREKLQPSLNYVMKNEAVTDKQRKELEDARSKANELTLHAIQEGRALELIEAYVPHLEAGGDQPESEELTNAKQELVNLRQELAAFNAKREKRMFFTDRKRRDTQENKALYEAYHNASRAVFNLENPNFIEDDTVSNLDKIRKIAEYTVEEAKNLDQAILESYKNTKTFLGKRIEQYSNLSVPKKIILGVGASALIGIATGGVGTFAVSGSFMAMTLEAKRRKKRSEGGGTLSVSAHDLASKYEGYDLSEGRASEYVDTIFDGANSRMRGAFEDRIDSEQKRRLARVAGSYAAGAAIGWTTHHLPGGWFDGWNSSHDVAAADHAGGGDVPTGGDLSGVPQMPEAPTPGGGDLSGIPQMPEAPAPSIDVLHQFSSEVYNNYPGKGIFETFQQMGVPQEQWQSALERVGPLLERTGDAYPMGSDSYGWSHIGSLSPEGAQILNNLRW